MSPSCSATAEVLFVSELLALSREVDLEDFSESHGSSPLRFALRLKINSIARRAPDLIGLLSRVLESDFWVDPKSELPAPSSDLDPQLPALAATLVHDEPKAAAIQIDTGLPNGFYLVRCKELCCHA